MTAKTIKKNANVKAKRITFTFSATEDLVYIINKLEIRLKGLNKSEIAKLALIELDNTLELRSKNIMFVESLSLADDNALLASHKSAKYTAKNVNELLQALKN